MTEEKKTKIRLECVRICATYTLTTGNFGMDELIQSSDELAMFVLGIEKIKPKK